MSINSVPSKYWFLPVLLVSALTFEWATRYAGNRHTHTQTNYCMPCLRPSTWWIVFYNSEIILVALVILGSQYSNIRVTATKLIRQDELVVVLILNNHKHPAISSVTRLHQIWRHVYIIRSCDSHVTTTIRWSLQACAMDGSTNLSFTGSVEKFASVRQPIIYQWSMITSFSLQASHIIRLVPTSPSINMSLRGEVNYRDHLSTQQRLFLDLNTAVLTVEDFVIPHESSLCADTAYMSVSLCVSVSVAGIQRCSLWKVSADTSIYR